jgi:hypothetical protein
MRGRAEGEANFTGAGQRESRKIPNMIRLRGCEARHANAKPGG